jgi:hypothetical protein
MQICSKHCGSANHAHTILLYVMHGNTLLSSAIYDPYDVSYTYVCTDVSLCVSGDGHMR